MVDRHPWPTRAAVRLAIFEYIDRVPRTGEVWYNRRRLHSTLGYVSPTAYGALAEEVTAA